MRKSVFIQKNILIMLLAALFLCLQGCGAKSGSTENMISVYYISSKGDSLECRLVEPEDLSQEKCVNCILDTWEKLNSNNGTSLYQLGVNVNECLITPMSVKMDVSEKFNELPADKRALIIAGAVKSFTGINGVENVEITVEGKPLCDRNGREVGALSEADYVEDAAAGENRYEEMPVTLYYSGLDTDKLVAVDTPVRYNESIQPARAVVEALINPPVYEEDVNYKSAINPDTEILYVTINDIVCYVNLSEKFLDTPEDVSFEQSVYSIVNSLVALNNVAKVQILVEGNSDIEVQGISLKQPLEMNQKITK